MTPRSARERLSELLFTLHEQAMDASNDPQRENIQAVQKTMRVIGRALPEYYNELYQEQRELMKEKVV